MAPQADRFLMELEQDKVTASLSPQFPRDPPHATRIPSASSLGTVIRMASGGYDRDDTGEESFP